MSVKEPEDAALKRQNYEFLSTLKEGERVGIDEKGRLYKVVLGKTSIETGQIFEKVDPRIEKIAIRYAEDSFRDKKFHHIKEGPKHFQAFMKTLSETNLITKKDQASLAYLWYDQRHRDLVKQGVDILVAEAIIVCEMVQDSNIPEEMRNFLMPVPTTGGVSGSYFIKNRAGKFIGIFKPGDEEGYMPNNPNPEEAGPGHVMHGIIRKGCLPGEGWLKEIAASKFNQSRKGIFNVPFTEEISVPFPKKRGSAEIVIKPGAFQYFVEGKPADSLTEEEIAEIPTEMLQLMMVFDMQIENTDRNGGNLFWNKEQQKLYLIDHGSILSFRADWMQKDPEDIESEVYFRWLLYPQSREPITENVKKEIFRNIEEQITILRHSGIDERSIRVIRLRMIVLQEGVKAGLTLNEVGKLIFQTRFRQKTFIDDITINVREQLEKDEKYKDEKLFLTEFKKAFISSIPRAKQILREPRQK